MQGECERGATPVPDLTNLDVYYEIGAELDLENIELLDARSYRALYPEKLAKWNDYAVLAPDKQFWPKRSPASSGAAPPRPRRGLASRGVEDRQPVGGAA